MADDTPDVIVCGTCRQPVNPVAYVSLINDDGTHTPLCQTCALKELPSMAKNAEGG